MKIIIVTLFSLLLGTVSAQFKSDLPALENVSRAGIDLAEPLRPGRKIVFTQNCNPHLPDTVGNGIVQFENLWVGKDRVVASIEFKDTVVQRLIFEFGTDDKEAWQYFAIPSDGFTELGKKSYYRTYMSGDYQYTCFINRRKVTLVKSAPQVVE